MSKGNDKKTSEAIINISKAVAHNGGGTQSCAPAGCPFMDVQGLCEKDKYNCNGKEKWKCNTPFNHSAK